jgi:hypothetical protein
MRWILALVLLPGSALASEECVGQLHGRCRPACAPDEKPEQGAFIDCAESDRCCVPDDARKGSIPPAAAGTTAARAGDRGASNAPGACDRLVRLNVSRLERSPLVDLQARVQAHRTTKLVLDALSAQLPGGRWREGDPFWEEAYALLNPEVLAQMKAAGEQELRYQEANLPRLLDPPTCEKHLALLESKLGTIAQDVQDASDTKQFLGSLEKAFPTPPRLQPIVAKVRRWISDGTARAGGPEVRRERARYAQVREELRAYGKRLLEGVKRMGDGRGPEQQEASREGGEQLFARHKDRLVDVIRRFRQANGP